jgi:hypothetical protein
MPTRKWSTWVSVQWTHAWKESHWQGQLRSECEIVRKFSHNRKLFSLCRSLSLVRSWPPAAKGLLTLPSYCTLVRAKISEPAASFSSCRNGEIGTTRWSTCRKTSLKCTQGNEERGKPLGKDVMSTEFSHIWWRSKGILMYLDDLIPSSIDNQNIVSHQIPIKNPKLFKSSEESHKS